MVEVLILFGLPVLLVAAFFVSTGRRGGGAFIRSYIVFWVLTFIGFILYTLHSFQM